MAHLCLVHTRVPLLRSCFMFSFLLWHCFQRHHRIDFPTTAADVRLIADGTNVV